MAFSAPKTVTAENDIEKYFRWYCEELVELGYLKSFQREAQTFQVLPTLTHKREKHFKTKPNEVEDFTMFSSVNYTYDARLIWTEKAMYLFTEIYNKETHFVFGMPPFVSHYMEIDGQTEIVSYVDVKPHHTAARFSGGSLSSFYTFPFIQKFLFMQNGLYINKAVPVPQGKHGKGTCLFATTFTPKRYRFTDKSKDLRKIHYNVVSLASYVKKKSALVEQILNQKNSKESQQTLL